MASITARTQIVIPRQSLPIFTRTSSQTATSLTPTPSRFPVNRIYCVGRNYREHALEMGGNPDREPPFFFTKPSNAIVDTTNNKEKLSETTTTCIVPYPPMTSSLHHEGELVVALKSGGLRIPTEQANDCIFGYAIGCDLTRRDLQAEAKKRGRPWDTSKGFDYSAPCGPIVPKEEIYNDLFLPTVGTSTGGKTEAWISLEVNGETRQESTLDKMIWNVPETISYLSKYFRLQPGDLIMTGTPAGVSEIKVGDSVSVKCGTLPSCDFTVGPPE